MMKVIQSLLISSSQTLPYMMKGAFSHGNLVSFPAALNFSDIDIAEGIDGIFVSAFKECLVDFIRGNKYVLISDEFNKILSEYQKGIPKRFVLIKSKKNDWYESYWLLQASEVIPDASEVESNHFQYFQSNHGDYEVIVSEELLEALLRYGMTGFVCDRIAFQGS